MNVYLYDPQTGAYQGSEAARTDPEETRATGYPVYLLPANATFVRPPNVGPNRIPVWTGSGWTNQIDFRGTRYWDETGEHRISAIGQAVPDHAASGPKPSDDHRLIGGQWVVDLARRQESAWKRLEAGLHDYIFAVHDYPQPTQITLQAIYADPDSNEAQRAACKAIFDWIRGFVLPYYYAKKAEILESSDPAGVAWDFSSLDPGAPGHTLAQIITMGDRT